MSDWQFKQIRWRYYDNLFKEFGYRKFSLREAYFVYWRDHWMSRSRFIYSRYTMELDNWGRMNASTTICAATQFRFLIRVRRGVYRVPRRLR